MQRDKSRSTPISKVTQKVLQNQKGSFGNKLLTSLAILLIFGSVVAGCLWYLNSKGSVDLGALTDLKLGGEAGFGKATFRELTPEELQPTEQWGLVPLNQLVVVLKDEQDASVAKDIAKQLEGEIVGEMASIDLYQIAFEPLPESEFAAALAGIRAMPEVETAFPNELIANKAVQGKPCSPFTDPVFEQDENRRAYDMIGMPEAWRIIKASKVNLGNVRVGVLDDAMYTGSDELSGQVKIEGDTTEVSEKDDAGAVVDAGLNHGTMVTHVIGANPNNGGAAGVASILKDKLTINVKNLYDGVRLPAPAADAQNDPTTATFSSGRTYTIKALVYLQKQVESGAKVINCSYGPEKPSADNEWINAAYQKFFKKMSADHPDVVFVAAAGNEGRVDGAINSKNYYPAGIPLPNVITVGALNNDGSKAAFSNFASGDGEVTLSAPGNQIVMGVDQNGQPVKANGTSFAAPQVTATIALLQSINPKLTAEEIKGYLTRSAAPGTTNGEQSIVIPEGMGAGVLRVDVAVLSLINDLRAKEGKAPLTAESLLNMSTVDLTAKGGGKQYTLTAILPEIADGSSAVTIEVNGQHVLEGSTSQTVGPNEEAIWKIEIEDPSVFVRVTRSDTETCATLNLNQGDFEGRWDTTLTITEDALLVLIAKTIGEAIDAYAAENGCETSRTEDGEITFIGNTSLAYFDITKLDELGTQYNLTSIDRDPEDEGVDLSSAFESLAGSYDADGRMHFSKTSLEDGVTLHFDIYLILEDEKTLSGEVVMYAEGTSEGIVFTSAQKLVASVWGTKVETE